MGWDSPPKGTPHKLLFSNVKSPNSFMDFLLVLLEFDFFKFKSGKCNKTNFIKFRMRNAFSSRQSQNKGSRENCARKANHHGRPQLLPTLDKPLQRLFAAYTRHLLVDHFHLFILGPVLLTGFLGCGFLWLQQLTVLDARQLYTPRSAPSWHEERIFSEAII